MQAAGSWSVDACCAVAGNECDPYVHPPRYCTDLTSSSDWLFGLWPGPPQRFEPIGADTNYQTVWAHSWPMWGNGNRLPHCQAPMPAHAHGLTYNHMSILTNIGPAARCCTDTLRSVSGLLSRPT